jgi:hypothetical protein
MIQYWCHVHPVRTACKKIFLFFSASISRWNDFFRNILSHRLAIVANIRQGTLESYLSFPREKPIDGYLGRIGMRRLFQQTYGTDVGIHKAAFFEVARIKLIDA